MKTSRNRIFAFVLLFVFVLSASLPALQMVSGSAPHAAGETRVYLPLVTKELKPVIPATTVALSAASTNQMTVSGDGATFTFPAENSELQKVDPGDVIVGDVSGAAPDGFLRKVTSVNTQGGQVVVTTEAATLEDTIQDGAIDATHSVNPGDIKSTVVEPGVILRGVAECPAGSFGYAIDAELYKSDYGSVTATGSLCFTTSFSFNLSIQNFALKELSFSNTSTETAALKIESTLKYELKDVEKKLYEHTFNSITFWIGWVPVVIVPVMSVYVGLDGSVEASFTAGVTQTASLTAGLRYVSDSGWNPIWNLTNEITPQVEPSIEVDVKAYAGVELELLLYGVAGPYAKIQAYLELQVKPLETPIWALYAGFEVPVGVEMKIAGKDIANYETTALEHKWRLMPPAQPQDPAPADEADNQYTNVTLSWSDPDGEDWTYMFPRTYDVYFEAGNSSPAALVSSDQAETSYDPGWLEPETQYFWKIVARGLLGLTTDGPVWNFTTGSNPTRSAWSGSGPGTINVVSDGISANPLFTYSLNPVGNPPTRTWDFTTVANSTGALTLDYDYSGLHAWFQVTAFLKAIVNGATVATLVNDGPVNCCTPPSNGFTYTGSFTFNVIAGDTYGFQFGGSNGDSNNFLQGTLEVLLPPIVPAAWNTFLGSAGVDQISAIALEPESGNVVVAGSSAATWGTPVHAYSGGTDAFVAKLDSNGVLLWNTFLGSAGADHANGISVDGEAGMSM